MTDQEKNDMISYRILRANDTIKEDVLDAIKPARELIEIIEKLL